MHVLNGKSATLESFIRDELAFPGEVKKSRKGMAARRVQEWLCLHGKIVAVDGQFGDATEDAVCAFQLTKNLQATGAVDEATHDALVAPLMRVLRPQVDVELPFGELVVAIGAEHLKEHPREVGGDNMGPWVRLYMEGNNGSTWFWCAGFVTFLMKQAADLKSAQMPIKGSFSCDTLAAQGKEKKRFLKENEVRPEKVTRGAIFLDRRTPGDWIHTGIVTRAEQGVFHTMEGNTNDDGHRNGFEACTRRRGYRSKDFVLI